MGTDAGAARLPRSAPGVRWIRVDGPVMMRLPQAQRDAILGRALHELAVVAVTMARYGAFPAALTYAARCTPVRLDGDGALMVRAGASWK